MFSTSLGPFDTIFKTLNSTSKTESRTARKTDPSFPRMVISTQRKKEILDQKALSYLPTRRKKSEIESDDFAPFPQAASCICITANRLLILRLSEFQSIQEREFKSYSEIKLCL
ncbi:hypothetical protein CEXT_214831 [Caerostris extrusa]|uniref:Uncharacterized protein n=1 Tax=Caerostris extrusa TaxID=172846 RepID=A0AAV4YEQ4_CAEEX|nr:hypothetical protein CEXT_214831 [Caerostris extrusa]